MSYNSIDKSQKNDRIIAQLSFSKVKKVNHVSNLLLENKWSPYCVLQPMLDMEMGFQNTLRVIYEKWRGHLLLKVNQTFKFEKKKSQKPIS